MDRVVEALLSAVAALEDFLQLYSHEHLAINALEEIADRLGQMTPEERTAFDQALARIAAAQDREAPGNGAWVRALPDKLGLA
ncbi:hypothetical protein KOI35_21880 [Actinoplanes bogorensis]|uniref:Uncharacterized protein n=1 Tax=Paractinoplanes bogorensis TaxID=1610840 RepID=A0ABS5YTY0_9ACTN|nr:hypothetical protein [Actinoplanes bogorensis]MBU2666153.1 hypothetical protein [Actinoplanes bogorensis]